jgi:hypothetical protein
LSRLDEPTGQVQRELDYLEEKGQIDIDVSESGGVIYFSLRITAEGTDAVEGKAEGNSISVGGDYYQVSVGDNNRNLNVGRENQQQLRKFIVSSPVGRLDAALREFLVHLEKNKNEYVDVSKFYELRKKIGELQDLLR